jgi:hypothetical protein
MQKVSMQKSGMRQEGDIHQPAQPVEEFHKAGLRTRISNYFVKKSRSSAANEAKLPMKEDLESSIDHVFSFSQGKQPSRVLNSGAGVADAASLYMMAFNHPVAFLGLAASEGISLAKNYANNRHYSGLLKSERKFLKKYKFDIMSTLESKLSNAGNQRQEIELKNLINETQSLFSAIDEKSKEHLHTALKSRLQGLGSSVGALILNNTIFKPAVDYTSNFFTNLARVQLVQFPGYNPDLALVELAVKTGFLITTSALILTVGYEARKDGSRSSQSRDDAMYELKDRADRLLERIQEILE